MRGVPGPGAYTNPKGNKQAAPCYTFGTSRVINKTKEVPGPGSYNIPCSFAALPQYSQPGKSAEYEYI